MSTLSDLIGQMVPENVQPSLRSAWNRHRFRPSDKGNVVSLRRLLNRRSKPDTVSITLLCYNTFLMRAELPLYDYLFPSPRSLPGASDTFIGSIIGAIPVFGPVVEAVVEAIEGGVKELLALPRDLIVAAVEHITGQDGMVEIVKKPALTERASEIGQAIYDTGANLVVLCEVWTDDLLDRILKPLRDAGSDPQVITGPSKGNAILGSGLCVLGMNYPITKIDEHVFSVSGSKLSDADAWARKSIIYCQVDVGVGKIDLYSTHLHSGGDIPDLKIVDNVPSEEDKHAVRIQQCEEIARFINKTHDPRNIALLMGDFNINAHEQAKYDEMSAIFRTVNLTDLWSAQYQDAAGLVAPGMTNGDFNKVCRRDTPIDSICNEGLAMEPDHGGSRIDYIFIEEPSDQHTFNLDLSVIRRNPFKRPAVTEGQEYMSDHLGLSAGLICSPIE